MSLVSLQNRVNYYSAIACNELDATIDAEVDSLSDNLQQLSLAHEQAHSYISGKIARPPLNGLKIEIDSDFLATDDGKQVIQAVDTLKKASRLVSANIAGFCKRGNDWFKDGTCVGESMAFMIARRPNGING